MMGLRGKRVAQQATKADEQGNASQATPDQSAKSAKGMGPQAIVVLASSLVVALVIALGRPALWDVAYEDVSTNAPVVSVDEADEGEEPSPGRVEGGKKEDHDRVPTASEDVLGVYEVRVGAGDETVRAKNLQAAARALNGVIIEPGETLSLNSVIGEPVAERGYEDVADVEYASDAIDQLATALHVAALKAGLSVPERYAHVIAVDYVPLGMDAAVSWNMDDLVIRNDLTSPISIQATASGTTVTVSILGTPSDPAVSIDVTSTVVETYSLPASEVYDDPLAQGLLSSDNVRFSRSETYLETYRNGELESSELLYADLYQMPLASSSEETP